MQITLFSFLSAIVWHSILIVIIYFMRRNDQFNLHCGVVMMIALYLGGVVRITIPLEFSHTVVIPSVKIYPLFYRILHKVCFSGTVFEVQIVSCLIFIWLVGSGILLAKYTVQYVTVSRGILKSIRPCSACATDIMEQVKRQAGKRFSVDVYTYPDTYIPFGFGVWKKKILLPDRDYNTRDLYYILLHEYTHFVNKDIIVKILISIFCIIFWWNPFVYLLKKDLEQALELKCDLTIVKRLDSKEKADYLQAILNALKEISRRSRVPYLSTALLQNRREIEIKERFSKIMNSDRDGNEGLIQAAFLILFAFLIAISYAFLLQPSFEAPDSGNDTHIIDFDNVNSYLKKTEDGKYELYIENKSRGIITDTAADMFIEDGFPIIEEENGGK